MSIAIIDYGMGNIRSVSNALDEAGHVGTLVSDPAAVADYDKVILPGVGAFAEAIENLRATGMVDALDTHVSAGKPLLGICLGMQLICRNSDEDGSHEGLGWVDAQVTGLPASEGLKVPHMGWNSLEFEVSHPIFEGLESGGDVYFVHSYYVDPADDACVLARTSHGIPFPSIIGSDSIVGMQFHPEKSQRIGLQLLANFVGWTA